MRHVEWEITTLVLAFVRRVLALAHCRCGCAMDALIHGLAVAKARAVQPPLTRLCGPPGAAEHCRQRPSEKGAAGQQNIVIVGASHCKCICTTMRMQTHTMFVGEEWHRILVFFHFVWHRLGHTLSSNAGFIHSFGA